VIDVTFFNPYPNKDGNWAYGIFLGTGKGDIYQVIELRSNGSWIQRYKLGYGTQLVGLRQEVSANIDNTDQGKNQIRLITVGNDAWLFVNEEFVGKLDLGVVTDVVHKRLYITAERDGEITSFENFKIWKWDPDLFPIP